MAFEQQKQTQLVLQAREHRAQAIRLLHEANALAPVARLPMEVLGRIFVFVRDAVVSSGSYTDVHWTVITLVCGLWNSVALRTPQFWSVISFTGTNTPFALTSLARAGATPLYITIGNLPLGLEESINTAITSQMERVKELRFVRVSSHDQLLRDLILFSTCRAPNLESLSITFQARFQINPGHEADRKVFALHSLFDGHTPHLRMLDMEMVACDWQAPIFVSPSLTELHITESFPVHSDHALEAHVLARVLGQLRMLKHLTIKRALPTAPLRNHGLLAPPSFGMADRDQHTTVTNALGCFNVPRTAKVTLEVRVLDLSSFDARGFRNTQTLQTREASNLCW